MANSTSNVDTINSSQSGKETTVNAFFDATSQAATYGRRASASSGLTWGYYGGNVTITAGTLSQIANGTLTLTASSTNYVVALKSTGAVSFLTTTTNWDNTTNYWRLYSVVTGASTVTSYTDSRQLGLFTTQGRSYAASLTAFAGGGQGSATALISEINHIGTCATAGDSVKLLPASPGLIQRIINRGAAACDVFPNTGGNLGAGTNTAISLAAGAGVTYACYSSTSWDKV